MAGSRPGALIATAWASLLHLGVAGYMEATQAILAAMDAFVEGLRSIPQLRVLGQPEMSVVAFAAARPKQLNIYALNDLLHKPAGGGWHLNALHRPAALHFCFTAMNAGAVQQLLGDIRTAVAALEADPAAAGKGGSAPVYGMSNASPDRGLLGEFLVAYQDTMLVP